MIDKQPYRKLKIEHRDSHSKNGGSGAPEERNSCSTNDVRCLTVKHHEHHVIK